MSNKDIFYCAALVVSISFALIGWGGFMHQTKEVREWRTLAEEATFQMKKCDEQRKEMNFLMDIASKKLEEVAKERESRR